MQYRKLGKTNLLVSEIGLGTAQIGGPSLIGSVYIGSPEIRKKEASKILYTAYNSGINFFDTSDKYGDGKAERIFGDVFYKNHNKVILATKCGITANGNRCFEKKYVKSCLNNSLKNLKTDYVDIFQLTKPNIDLITSGEIYETLDELKKEGKIRFSGVSTGADEETLKLISDNKIDTLQIFYNLLHIKPNELFIKKAFDYGIGLIIKSPLSSGILTGKFSYDTKFSNEDDRSSFLYGKTLTSRIDMINKIVKYFKLDKTSDILELSLNYLLSNGKISTIIPGVSKASQLSDILKLCEIERMSPEKFKQLESFIKEILADNE